MATFLDLPAELVIAVSSHLETKDLGPMRRSCKKLEKDLFESFANEFFTKRQFMIEHVSLKALVEISKHPTLSPRLTEVIISTEAFSHLHPADPEYSSDDTSREWLLRTGQARDMLAEAFSNLKNLRIVGLRDYNAKRVRDGPHARWNSYGWSTNPGHTMSSDLNPSTLFSLILWALGSASALPQEVQVILRKHHTLVPHAFRVNAANATVIAKLKTLFLTLQADNGSGQLKNEDPLRRLLHTAASLEVLRLNFDYSQPEASRLLKWLGTPSAATDLSLDAPGMLEIPPAPLANLTGLDIGMATISSTSLLRAISRFKLTSFSLWKVNLSADQVAQPNADKWSEFLGALSRALGVSSSIETVLIGEITQAINYNLSLWAREKVTFCPEGTQDKEKLDVKTLRKDVKFRAHYGMDVSGWLEALSKRTYVRSIHAPPVPPPDSESDEAEEEEEDEQSEDGDHSSELGSEHDED